MIRDKRIRVLAMIYPIERHVGHWACSSELLDVQRVIIEGIETKSELLNKILDFDPEAIAIIGKKVGEYHDLLDGLGKQVTSLKDVPRIYRCQNTVLAQRIDNPSPSKEELAALDHWFAFACDERFSLILVQTLTDVDLIQRALAPKTVVACPYGYDPAIFNPDFEESERSVDVGIYYLLRNDPRRVELVHAAAQICERRGWSIQFASGIYWHKYAHLIRNTKVCLHRSDQSEVPFRLFETTCLGALFVTDPLACGVERLFQENEQYLTYKPDLSDLEDVLESVLEDRSRWDAIRQAGKKRARQYSWPHIADRYVAPALQALLGR
jgi:glycosyltransferase involved in cell wall biosynthesis